MARKGARLSGKEAAPILEVFKGIKHGCISVGTSVTAVPATNLSYRKGLILQNKHASNTVYIGGGIPYLIMGSPNDIQIDPDHDKRSLVWKLSGSGTNEWCLVTSANGDPGLTQARYLYYATVGGSETLGTSGTVGSLAAEHNWGWGDSGSENGFNTIYIRTNGSAAANSPSIRYELIHAYYFVLTADDTANTGGIELGPRDSIQLTVDGSVRTFAIASGASTAVGYLEVI